MAGDWIKMRTDLYRDPKIIIMADLLMSPEGDLAQYVNQNMRRDMTVTRNVMRNATCGALLSVWGVLRHRGKRKNDDLIVKNASLNIIDDICELPGFGQVMANVGWAAEGPEGLIFPRFFEYYNVEPNSDEKEKNKERQRRYRDKKRNALRNVTVTSQNNIEKSRVEKSIKNKVEQKPRSTSDEFLALKYFGERFKNQVGEKYPASFKKELVLLKGIVKSYGLAKTQDLIDIFFEQAETGEAWHSDKLTIGVFSTSLPKLITDYSKERARANA